MKAALLSTLALVGVATGSSNVDIKSFTRDVIQPIAELNLIGSKDFTEERRLALDCPDADFAPPAEDAVPIEAEPSVGSKASAFLGKLRGGSGTFYADVLHQWDIYKCNLAEDGFEEYKHRCVAEDDGDAAKDWAGNCIRPSDSPCISGPTPCERVSNCYWKEPIQGEGRMRRFTDEEADLNEEFLLNIWDQESYIFSIAKYLIIAVLFAVLNTIFWTIFILGRCCCCCLWENVCKCCSPKPKEEGYNLGSQVRIPVFCYLILVVGISACGILTFIGNGDLTVAVADTFDHSREGIVEMHSFLDNAAVPISNIGDLVEQASDDCVVVLDNTDYVQTDMNEIIASLKNFSDIYADGIEQAGASDSIDEMNANLDSEVQTMVDTVMEMLDTMKTSLVDGKDQIKESIDNAYSQVVDLNSTVASYTPKLNDAEGQIDEYKNLRTAGVLAIFAIAAFCVLFGVIGVFAYATPCEGDNCLIHLMNLTWFFGSGVVTLALILAGATMVAAVTQNDVCHFADIMVEDFEPYIGSEVSSGLNTCVSGGGDLVEAYNLTSKVDFQGKIDAELDEVRGFDVNAKFTTIEDPIKDVSNEIKAINEQTFVDKLNTGTNVVEKGDPSLPPGTTTACPFNDDYTLINIKELWSDRNAATNTVWNSMYDGTPQSYERGTIETNEAYLVRIYGVAGICSASDDCGLDDKVGAPNYSLMPGDTCNLGADCQKNCEALTNGIVAAYTKIVDTIQMKADMLADLGYEPCPVGQMCPTQAFIDAGHNDTVWAQVSGYQTKLVTTQTELLDITESSIGAIMTEIEGMLCSMNCRFVGDVWNKVSDDLCTTFLGGVLQISVSLGLLSFFMFFNAVLGAILVVRMRGDSKDEVLLEGAGSSMSSKGVDLDIYG